MDRGEPRKAHQSGLTLGRYPTNNFIASDVAGNRKLYTDVGVLAVFIHELGNSIAIQLMPGQETAFKGYGLNGINDNDRDYGTNLEACVFGGIVGLRTGRVGSNREL